MIALFQYAFKIAITGEYALLLTLANATNGKIPGEMDVQMAEFLYFKNPMATNNLLGGLDITAQRQFMFNQKSLG